MPQQDAFGRVTTSGTDVQNNQAVDFMLRQALANQQAQVAREGIQSQERLGNRGFDTTIATQGTFAQKSAQDAAHQAGYYTGEGGLIDKRASGDLSLEAMRGMNANSLEGVRGTNSVNLAHENNAPAMGQLDFNKLRYNDSEGPLARIKARAMSDFLGYPADGSPGAAPAAMGPMTGGGMFAPATGAPAGGGALNSSDRRKLLGSFFGVPGLGEDPIEQAVTAAAAKRIGEADDPAAAAADYQTTHRLPESMHMDPMVAEEYKTAGTVMAPYMEAIKKITTETDLGPDARVAVADQMRQAQARLTSMRVHPKIQAMLMADLQAMIQQQSQALGQQGGSASFLSNPLTTTTGYLTGRIPRQNANARALGTELTP